jgi:release factor glutamine methyltransferase
MLPFNFWYQQLQQTYAPEEAKAILGKFLVERTGRSLAFWIGEHESEWNTYIHELQQLANGIPVQYVLGYEWFGPLRIGVNSSVLIPRPETWELVQWASEKPSSSILDLCTGSGCIALAMAHFFTKATVGALDVSEKALEVAEKNRNDLGLSVQFFQTDLLNETPPTGFETWISNPPYVGLAEKQQMENHVLDHEPHLALFVEDPLLFYQRLVDCFSQDASAKQLFCEINPLFAEETLALGREFGWKVSSRMDFRGKLRMIHWEK